MKKTLLMMMLAIAGMAMPGMAQQTLKVPFFREFVKVKEGAALRKAPNTSSEKLVLVEEDFMNVFGWAKTGDNAKVTYAALNGENGDWYDVYVSDEWLGAENAFVQKISAAKVQTKALSLPAQDYLHVVQIKTGKYKDWYIQFFEEGMDTDAKLAFGVPIEGKILMLKQIRIYNGGGTTSKLEKEEGFYKDQYGEYAFNFSNEFGNTFEFKLDVLASNTKVVEMLLDKFYTMGDYMAIFFGVAGSNDWQCIPINKEKYKGKMFNLN